MRLLYDAVLPQTLALEAPDEFDLERWGGGEISDAELVRSAADRECQGLILLGRDALEQPDLRTVAQAHGVGLVAVATNSPIEAKQRVLNHLSAIASALASDECLVVYAASVRPLQGQPQ